MMAEVLDIFMRLVAAGFIGVIRNRSERQRSEIRAIYRKASSAAPAIDRPRERD